MDDTAHQEVYIPLASSPNMISSILDISSDELGMGENIGEYFLLKKACDLKGWDLRGSHPRYTVGQWIEVLITGPAQAHCRIFNCRTHHSIRPLTLQKLLETIEASLAELHRHHTHPKFGKYLEEAYFELSPEGEDVKLMDLLRVLQKRFPAYRRESFGLDLFFALENHMLEGFEASLLAGGECPRIELFTLSEPTGPQVVHRLLLTPITEMQSLDI